MSIYNKEQRYEALSKKLREKFENIEIIQDAPLKDYTSFKIGGPADLMIRPDSISQLGCIMEEVRARDIPYFILGNGSNLLVNDKGFRGVVIQIYKNMGHMHIENGHVVAQAGILLSTLSKRIAKETLAGFEFASGIPGTLGGAVYMNAGAYGGEIKDHIISVTAMDKDGGIHKFNKDECKLGYRHSVFQENDYFILEAEFQFPLGEAEEIESKMKDFTARRKDKQPLDKPSAGSTFKRPEGYYAGKLIMDAGLRGYSIGDAQVSEKHCGFVINKGNATACDVIALINYVRKRVYSEFRVEMHPEVRILGEVELENVKLEPLK